MANPLGQCERKGLDGDRNCSGLLQVSSGPRKAADGKLLPGRVVEVVCGRCGTPHPDHPLAKQAAAELAAEAARPAPKPAECLPMDYAASVPDRVSKLEKLVAQQAKQIFDLQAQLAQAAARGRKGA